MTYSVTQESFDSLASLWASARYGLRWNPIFVLPPWLIVWWQELGPGAGLYLAAVRRGEEVIGVAPLLIKDGSASFIGSVDVCDYLDFVVTPGMELDFFGALLQDLREKGINHLDLRLVRPDSTVLTKLAPLAREQGNEVLYQKEDVSFELDLPTSWEEYLEILTAKQRHELKRKLRRLLEAGKIDYHCVKVTEGLRDAMDAFLKMFRLSREDKAGFMTSRMESFFRSMADVMARAGLLRLGFLELDAQPVAMIMGFDYNDSMYLYNSAYEPNYRSLSVGLLSKALCIKENIQEGKKRFDFLKGNETYKQHLGGREVPLYSCQISLKGA